MTASLPYQPLPNTFRRSVSSGESLIGCWAALASPITTELLGMIGFDWLLLDAEHAPNDVLSLIPQLMALKDSRSAPVVRPPANDSVVIKRLLDGGFFNFLIPFVDSAANAERAVAATRYPPQGIRGVSVGQRGNRYGTVANYLAERYMSMGCTIVAVCADMGLLRNAAQAVQKNFMQK
jgi:2-dehydro-3-deoxyglucarate aldolase